MNSDDFNRAYPFCVYLWYQGGAHPKTVFDESGWREAARCKTRRMADEVALCLSLRHPSGVQAAELVHEPGGGARFVGYKFLPSEAAKFNPGE